MSAAARPRASPSSISASTPPMEGREPVVGAARAGAPGHEGPRARPAFDQSRFLEVAVDLAHRHGGDARVLGEVAHRGQPVAGPQVPAGDAVGDEAAQLQAERDRQCAIEGEADRGDAHLC